jgi:hypothetical protein
MIALLLQFLLVTTNYSAIVNLPTSQITRTSSILILVLRQTVLSNWLMLYSLELDHSTQNTSPALLTSCIARCLSTDAARTIENTAPRLPAACVLRVLPSNGCMRHNILWTYKLWSFVADSFLLFHFISFPLCPNILLGNLFSLTTDVFWNVKLSSQFVVISQKTELFLAGAVRFPFIRLKAQLIKAWFSQTQIQNKYKPLLNTNMCFIYPSI